MLCKSIRHQIAPFERLSDESWEIIQAAKQGASAYKVAINLTKDDFDLQKKFQYEYGKSLRVNKQFDKSLEQLHLAMETKSNLIPERFIQEEINKAKASDCS